VLTALEIASKMSWNSQDQDLILEDYITGNNYGDAVVLIRFNEYI